MARILVVEDSPTIISSVEALLRQHRHKVYTARDGLAAFAAVRAFAPEVILLDILLPHMDGYGVCAALREKETEVRPTIIMMSCLNREEDIRRAYDAGADGYITKPLQEDTLLAAIGQNLVESAA